MTLEPFFYKTMALSWEVFHIPSISWVFSFVWYLCEVFHGVFKMWDRLIWPTQTRYRTPTSTSLHLSSPYSGITLGTYVLFSLSGSVNICIANLQFALIEEAGIVQTCEFESHWLCNLGQITHSLWTSVFASKISFLWGWYRICVPFRAVINIAIRCMDILWKL